MDGEKHEREALLVHTYNDALSVIGLGRFHYLLLLACGLCLMSALVEALNIGFIIPLIDLECDLKLELTEKGILNSAALAGIVTSSYLWGFLADIKGRHKIMLICSTMTFISSFISSFSTHVIMLIIARFSVGFFISALSANTYAYLGEFLSEKHRAKYVNLCSIFLAFAFVFCPTVGMIVMSFKNFYFQIPLIDMKYSVWRIFLLICSLLSFTSATCLYFLLESPKFLLSQERHNEALEIMAKIYKWNKNSGEFPIMKIDINETIKEKSSKSFCTQFITQSTQMLRKPLWTNTWKIAFVNFSLFIASSGFFLWVPEILNQIVTHPGESVCDVMEDVINAKNNKTTSVCEGYQVNRSIYEVTFLMGCFFAMIYFLNALIIKKVGKKNLLAIWFAFCALSSFLILFTKNHYAINFLLLILLTSGCNGSIVNLIIVDSYPTNVRAISLCVHSMIGRLGAVLGSIYVSLILKYSCEAMFSTFGTFLAISIVISLILNVQNK